MIELTREWKTFELPGSQIFIERYKFFVTLENAGEVEIRNVKVLTEDKSEMVEFEFYWSPKGSLGDFHLNCSNQDSIWHKASPKCYEF